MALRVLVLDCGGITNPDCEAGMADVAAAMGVNEEDATLGHKAAWSLARSDPTFTEYWDHAFKVAGVPPDARTKERQEACEVALGAALRVNYPDSLEAASWARSQGTGPCQHESGRQQNRRPTGGARAAEQSCKVVDLQRTCPRHCCHT